MQTVYRGDSSPYLEQRVSKPKLEQETVNAGCIRARGRYAEMTEREAHLSFSYEAQGFIADMVDRGTPLPSAILKVTQLLDVLAKANGI